VFRSSIITYDGLPVSKGGAHRLRTPNPKLALQQARDFLTACTDTSIPKVAFVEVIRGHSFDDEFSLPLIEQLTKKLGRSSQRQAGTRNIAHRWNLNADQIDEYVDMMNEAVPLPVDPFGLQPFVVAAQINFRILNPQTRVVLSGQESELYGNYSAYPGQVLGTSQLYARISGRSTFSLFLNFPFEQQTAAFQSAVAHVQDHLPFPLSQKHWKQWRPTKNGIGYVGRRIIVQAGRASSKNEQ
jgi:hypothetical protein